MGDAHVLFPAGIPVLEVCEVDDTHLSTLPPSWGERAGRKEGAGAERARAAGGARRCTCGGAWHGKGRVGQRNLVCKRHSPY